MANRLRDKVAIVTGGTAGIGRAVAEVFVAEGARVAVCGRRQEPLDDTLAALRAAGGEAIAVRCDVSDETDVERLIQQTVDAFGRLDVLVNNAGCHLSKPAEHTTEEEWDFIINTNLKSTFLCSKYAIPHLRKTQGSIINISSMVGVVGQSNAGAYSASKGGQVAMTMNMALDLAADQVRVNAICPGWVETPLVEDWFNQQDDPEASRKYIYGAHPLGRIGTVDEVGRAAVFLACADSSFLSGTALHLDGALTLGY